MHSILLLLFLIIRCYSVLATDLSNPRLTSFSSPLKWKGMPQVSSTPPSFHDSMGSSPCPADLYNGLIWGCEGQHLTLAWSQRPADSAVESKLFSETKKTTIWKTSFHAAGAKSLYQSSTAKTGPRATYDPSQQINFCNSSKCLWEVCSRVIWT